MDNLRVTIWNEFVHERQNAAVARICPRGLHQTLADALHQQEALRVRTATLDESEMYGEPFAIPTPDDLIFISWFEGGEVFRGGCTWTRGSGRIFYFSPGHEAYPIYHHPDIQRVITNAVLWARPQGRPADVPRHVPVEQARQKLTAKGPSVHDAAGRLTPPKG